MGSTCIKQVRILKELVQDKYARKQIAVKYILIKKS